MGAFSALARDFEHRSAIDVRVTGGGVVVRSHGFVRCSERLRNTVRPVRGSC